MKKKKTKKTQSRIFRFSDEDIAVMQLNADKYTGGILSRWIRHAAKYYRPERGEKIHWGKP